jgi:predicted nucleotidyltransferase
MSTQGGSEMKEATVGYKTNVQFPALHDLRYPVHNIAHRIEPYLRVLVEEIHPEKIILFGSYAYGNPTEHSDFDLLVIRRDIRTEKESNLQIRRAFDRVPGVPPPFTILSKTPERISNRLAVHSPLYEDILEKGLVLYAA